MCASGGGILILRYLWQLFRLWLLGRVLDPPASNSQSSRFSAIFAGH
jgi:hypothetical protein